MAADRTPFHIFCIKCSQCNKKLTPASINEHEKKLFCPSCYEDIFNKQVSEISSECIYFQCLLWQDDIPERMVMQVLPIQGMFIVVSVIKFKVLDRNADSRSDQFLGAKEERWVSVTRWAQEEGGGRGGGPRLEGGHHEDRLLAVNNQNQGNLWDCSWWLHNLVKILTL